MSDTMYFSRLTIPVERHSKKRWNKSNFVLCVCVCLHCFLILTSILSTLFSGLLSHFLFSPHSCCYILFESKCKAHEEQMHSQFVPPPLTCCIVLVVDDELRDGVEVVLLCQIKLALRRGAYVIMSAASCRFPARRPVRLESSRCRRQISHSHGNLSCGKG